MGERTGIEWTDHTFNVAWGCVKVSPGCANCYAEGEAKRRGHQVFGPAKTTARRTFGEHHWNEPRRWNRAAEKAGQRRRVFCSSMADVFEDHPTLDAERPRLWALVRETPWLDWQILTKRPERIAAHLPEDWGQGYPNVWLGTSVENQDYGELRIPHLLQVPAAVRFLSCEPLLGPVDLGLLGTVPASWGYSYIPVSALLHWVIVGGESGPKARPCALEWIESLIDQCESAEVAVFVKQLGAVPMESEERWRGRVRTRLLSARNRNRVPAGSVPLAYADRKGGDWEEWPIDLAARQFPEVSR